jgi:hypothetical protein
MNFDPGTISGPFHEAGVGVRSINLDMLIGVNE